MPQADLRAGHDAGLFQLCAPRSPATSSQRVSGETVRRLRRPAHLRAARHEATRASASRCRPAAAADVDGYPRASANRRSRSRSSGRRRPARCRRPATDMARFMIAHLQDGELDGKRILQAETARDDAQQPARQSTRSIPPLNRMKLGFYETNINGRDVIAHRGDTEAFHTSLHLFMDDGVGLYVSFNSGGQGRRRRDAARRIVRGLRRSLSPRAARGRASVDAKTAAEHAAADGRQLGESAAASQSSFLSVARPARPDQGRRDARASWSCRLAGHRTARRATGSRSRPSSGTTSDGHDRLAAKVVDGKVVRFSIDVMSPFMVFDRVPGPSQSARGSLPCSMSALGCSLLTVLLWPIAWHRPPPLRRDSGARRPDALRAYRATRISGRARTGRLWSAGVLVTHVQRPQAC